MYTVCNPHWEKLIAALHAFLNSKKYIYNPVCLLFVISKVLDVQTCHSKNHTWYIYIGLLSYFSFAKTLAISWWILLFLSIRCVIVALFSLQSVTYIKIWSKNNKYFLCVFKVNVAFLHHISFHCSFAINFAATIEKDLWLLV